MQRNDREPGVENPDTKTYKTYKETRHPAGETKDMLSQLLMWIVPLLLIGFLGYYLYRTYYSTPLKVTRTATTAPVTAGVTTEKTVMPETTTAAAVEKAAEKVAAAAKEATATK